MMVIQPIVEGKGEVAAAREILGRLMDASQRYDFQIARPIRQTSSQLLTVAGIERAVSLARQTDNLAAIIILFDGDVDILRQSDIESCFCPANDIAQLAVAAKAASGNIPCEIVVPYKEFETWLLAGIEGLVAAGKVKPDSVCPQNLEEIRGVKERLSQMLESRPYLPASHQTSFTRSFDLQMAYTRARSFRKLVKVFGEFHNAYGAPIANWPPQEWLA